MHMKKKILSLLCAITCMLSLCACGGSANYSEKTLALIEDCKTIANCDYMIATYYGASEDMVSELTSTYNKQELASIYANIFYNNYFEYTQITSEAELGAFNGMLTTYLQASKEMEGIVSKGDVTAEVKGGKIIVTIQLLGNACDGQFKFTFSNDIYTKLIEAEATANTSFAQKMHAAGQNMGKAGLNTILGMGTVFIMLIVISFIISAFKLIGNVGKKPAKEVSAPVAAPVAAPEAEELVDDTELVAVIMAAISAYEGNASTDGFVVRSIRKANRRI